MRRPCYCYGPIGCYCWHKPYTFGMFLWDIFMLFLTCGVWGIWIIIRQCRR